MLLMPYKLKGNCVIKSNSGEVVKCHRSKRKALAHLAALRINVREAARRQAVRRLLEHLKVNL